MDPLPCPFCGERMVIFESDKLKTRRWTIVHEVGGEECVVFYVREHTREAALAIWNRRAPVEGTSAHLANEIVAAVAHGYPPSWPKCPSCGAPAMDGHVTCGSVDCKEADHR